MLTLEGNLALTRLQAEALMAAAKEAIMSHDIGNNSHELTGRQRESLAGALAKLEWACSVVYE